MNMTTNQDAGTQSVHLFGFYVSVAMALITIVTLGMAFFTPPLSGPFCPGDCFSYPYTGIESRFPRDYLWMYPAILLNVVFVIFSLSIHHFAPGGKKLFSQAGSAFALISVACGIGRETLFEIAVITINWTVLIVNGILMARVFRRATA
jgi:hypothetical protein